MLKLNAKIMLVPVALLSGYLGSQIHKFDNEKSQGTTSSIEVYFSPKGGCTQAIVDEIDNASNLILIQAYSFTSEKIVEALVNAVKRGVIVRCIMDKREVHGKGSRAGQICENINDFAIDTPRGLAHSKVMIIDNETIVTGSFNFTQAAENRNVENLLVIKDVALAKKYSTQWGNRRDKCIDYPQK